MRAAAHQFFLHQTHLIVLSGRHAAASFSHGHVEQIGVFGVRHFELQCSATNRATADRFARFFLQRNLDRLA